MTTVSTTQTPDLLLSFLMGMVGAASPANSATTPDGDGGMMFAQLLEPTDSLSLAQAEPSLSVAEPSGDDDFLLGDYSAAGQLNALMTASLGTTPNLSFKPAPTETGESLEALDSSGGRSQARSANSPNSNSPNSKSLNANSLFLSGSGVLGYPVAEARQSSESSPDSSVTGEAVDALTPEQTAVATPLRKMVAEDRVGNDFQPAVGANAKQENLAEPVPAAGMNRVESLVEDKSGQFNSENPNPFDATQVTPSNQATPFAVESSEQKETFSTRGSRSRSAKSVDRDSESLGFSLVSGGGFGGTGDSPMVTAISGEMQSRQDGIAGRGDSREELASQIFGRDSKGPGVDLKTPEATPQLDLNAAQADFEQSLDKVAENFPLDSVAQQIVEVAEPDAGWISVEIQPPDLGKLEIMVSKQGDDYTARIIAHEASTEEALNLQQSELLEALNQHGLELKEIQIVSDSESGSRWNLDSSNQQYSDSEERREYPQERREDSQAAFSPANKPHSSSNVNIQAPPTQQINFLV